MIRTYCADCGYFFPGNIDCSYCGSTVCVGCYGSHLQDHIRHHDEPWNQEMTHGA